MKSFINIGNACFPCTMNKTYLIGMSFMMKVPWKGVESKILHLQSVIIIYHLVLMDKDTVEKMQSIGDDELNKIQETIDPSQLEQKFGGKLPNLTQFW